MSRRSFHLVLTAVLAVLLLAALAACRSQGTPGTTAAPTPTEATVPGLAEAGPFSRYWMDLVLDQKAQRLKGRGRVTVVNRAGVDLEEIVFRLYPNLPQYAGRMGVGPVWVDDKRLATVIRADDTALAIPLPRRLAPGASTTISLTFDVAIPTRDSSYVLFGFSQGIYSLPDAYPVLAVHDGVRWHEDLAPPYSDAVFSPVALYDVSLTLPPTMTLATTGSVIGSALDTQGRRVYQIRGRPLREFAWAASSAFRLLETVSGGVTVRSYHLPGDEVAGQAALTTAVAALHAYGRAFGPYPYAEMNVVEAPLAQYGMEYPNQTLIGLDLYRDQRRELEIRVAHEIAHQWWYSQVSNDQVNRPWLDEGLSEYSTAIYFSDVYGPERAGAIVTQRWQAPYRAAVEAGADAVADQPAAAFGQSFEVIVYAKAALFFEALHRELGDTVFRSVLRAYLERFRWGEAEPADFMAVAEELSGKDLDPLYRDWILSKR